MKTIGIVAEYNPFHNGHIYQINSARDITKSQGTVAVISGNFVQRGLPSILDKWHKTELCLINGIDLVIELPALYSISSAEFFSFGAVSLLNSLGVIDSISFGSECTDIKILTLISEILVEEPLEFKVLLKKQLKSGASYASARSFSLEKFINRYYPSYSKYDIKKIISSSNNILAIEYIKSLKKLKSNINIVPVKRKGASHSSLETEGCFSSASAIRNILKSNKSIEGIKTSLPDCTYSLLKKFHDSGFDFSLENKMVPYIKYKSLFDTDSLSTLPDATEGIENRILESINKGTSYDSIVKLAKTKRYTYSRISRILCQFFLGFDKFDILNLSKMSCPYARVLGFNKTGRQILKEASKKSSIPIYTRFPKNTPSSPVLKIDTASTRAYSLLNESSNFNLDYKKSVIVYS